MDEQDSISGVWLEALAIIRRYPYAVIVPGAVLGALAEAPAYLIVDRLLLDQLLTYLSAAFAYYLFLAYAEGLTTDYERGMEHIASRSMLGELLEAAAFVPRVLMAALIAVTASSAALGLLVVPGVWLYTRWSLATPVIRREGLGVLGAISRSNHLVRGNFWLVFLTATVAYYLEGGVTHAGAEAALLVTGSSTWGEWVGGSMVATLAIPLGAFATSLAYSSLTRHP